MTVLTDSVRAAERNKRGPRSWFLLPWKAPESKVEGTFHAQRADANRWEIQLIETATMSASSAKVSRKENSNHDGADETSGNVELWRLGSANAIFTRSPRSVLL